MTQLCNHALIEAGISWGFNPRQLNAVGNISFGFHQQISRQADNLFIGTTACRWWQLGDGDIGYINANYGEVAAFQLPNIRATATTDRLCSIGVRIGAKSAKKHGLCIHAKTTIGERCENCKH